MSEIHTFPLTPAERAKRYRERQKVTKPKRRKRRRKQSEVTTPNAVTPTLADTVTAALVGRTADAVTRDVPTPSRRDAGKSKKPSKGKPVAAGIVAELCAYIAALALASIAGYFSVTGEIALFPGAPVTVAVMGVTLEAAKLAAVAFLARHWRTVTPAWRVVVILLVLGVAAINASGVFAQLTAAYAGDHAKTAGAAETALTMAEAKGEVQAAAVVDLDKQIAQIDAAIGEMTRRGKAAGALEAIAAQRRQREALVAQRRREAEALAAIKVEQAGAGARAKVVESETAPIRFLAEVLGVPVDRAIRLLILMMVLTCDPLSLALTAAAAGRRRA